MLSRRVVDLKNRHLSRKGGLTQGKAVEARAQNDILADAPRDCCFEGILGVLRPNDSPSIAEVSA
jgi:hypothetical protein